MRYREIPRDANNPPNLRLNQMSVLLHCAIIFPKMPNISIPLYCKAHLDRCLFFFRQILR